MKVLVIDDSRAMRALLCGMMESFGLTTIEAEDGKKALEQLSSNPDTAFALVDWNMPVMNGLDFVKQVRTDASYQGTKLIMVTTEVEMDQVVRALDAGADEYIMKPFTEEILKDKLSLLGLM